MPEQPERKVYLASQSPRRKELLTQIKVQFESLNVDIDESVNPSESALDYVSRMAQEKACAGENDLLKQGVNPASCIILGADTSVILNQKILGKPKNDAQAMQMLQSLSGQTHQVITSVCARANSRSKVVNSITQVTFGEITDATIVNYIASGEGADKAGSYAIQGNAARFIQSIQGSYSGVVGLPLYETAKLLEDCLGNSQ
ncbi:Maf family protein [Aliikangiella sp. IMCC44653]